jgi:2-keto-4-pentenoate hydratase/2-oxohepta-3-ene-1,7-dioic acid hydratase in catechol pathway
VPLTEWTAAWQRGEDLAGLTEEPVPLAGARLLAPVDRTSKTICMGLNYRKHVEAFGNPMPDVPVAFIKAPTAIIGPDDTIRYPPLTQKLDFEIELVIMIGRTIEPGMRPMDAAIGYTIGNDVTARDLSKGPRGADLYSAKSQDDTCGIGPWVVTIDEIGKEPDLLMELRVNGETRQSDRCSTMEWNVDEVLEYVNARTRLEPGDLVFTGTPAGVALEDGRFLVDGDVVECEIEKIGLLRNTVRGKSAVAAADA